MTVPGLNGDQFLNPIQELKDELMDPDLESIEYLLVPEDPNFSKIWYMLDDWDD